MNDFVPQSSRAGGVTVVGSGYVGTVVAACFASLGHHVTGLEIDPAKLAHLQRGEAPFHEPGIDELLAEGMDRGRLRFTGDVDEALRDSDVVFLCVGTPSGPDGHADVSALEAAARSVGAALRRHHVIVTKSTVPVGTGRRLAAIIDDALPGDVREAAWRGGTSPFAVVSNPEFLREGSAIDDFLYPDRVVLGGDDPAAVDLVADLYRPILDRSRSNGHGPTSPVLVRTSLETAEMVKYASNAFLATKISFANEIANICERVDADVTEVTSAMGLDARIGAAFLDAGVGWGGSCFGKDVRELAATARDHGYRPAILEAAVDVNARQRTRVVHQLKDHLGGLEGRRIGVLGLAFKPGTDDVRDAPGLDIVRELLTGGAEVVAHDPMVRTLAEFPDLRHASDALGVAKDADAVVLVTDWPDYAGLDLMDLRRRMRGDLLVDGRNLFDPAAVAAVGLQHLSVGRPAPVRADLPA